MSVKLNEYGKAMKPIFMETLKERGVNISNIDADDVINQISQGFRMNGSEPISVDGVVLTPNSFYTNLLNQITATFIRDGLDFENPLSQVFFRMQEPLGDTYRVITNSLGDVADFDPNKKIFDGSKVYPQREQYFKSVMKKLVQLTTQNELLARAFTNFNTLGSELANQYKKWSETMEYKFALIEQQKLAKSTCAKTDRQYTLTVPSGTPTINETIKSFMQQIMEVSYQATYLTTYGTEVGKELEIVDGNKWFDTTINSTDWANDKYVNIIATPRRKQIMLINFKSIVSVLFDVMTVFFNSSYINLDDSFGGVIAVNMKPMETVVGANNIFAMLISDKLFNEVYQFKGALAQPWANSNSLDTIMHYWTVFFEDKTQFGVAFLLPTAKELARINKNVKLNKKQLEKDIAETTAEAKAEVKKEAEIANEQDIKNEE